MATTKYTITKTTKPSNEQLEEVRIAAERRIVFDDDSPALTPEQYAEMSAMAREKRERMKKPVIALRINPITLEKAKATGKGYTGFLSRLLDNAIDDPEIVKKSL